ncbi:energy transducer TonB [Acidicapsa ligni]|uniref:energy transducer TonB n=1 Tax=Acidicapsa ligni TaxID=542300 RepID=UPI0021DF7561|nr:energy transducer TonB [Acidicapsa ligni]
MQFLAKSSHTSLNKAAGTLRQDRLQFQASTVLLGVFFLGVLFVVPVAFAGQAPSPAPQPAAAPASQPAATPAPQPAQPVAETPATNNPKESSALSEEELKRELVGKPLFLRNSLLGDSLSFNEHGDVLGHPTVGSFTLSAVEIEKIRLTKHKVELEGTRYALHFLGATPYEDGSNAIDRVRITPKKKVLKITIDREQLIKEKKSKEEKKKGKTATGTVQPGSTAPGAGPVASSETDTAAPELQAETATASEEKPTPEAEKAADPASQTSTTSPAHAVQVLRDALSRIFAAEIDPQMRSKMPQFWQLYYQAKSAGVEYRPSDPNVLRSNAVDQQAKVITFIKPESNEFAQANGIAGSALYRTVVGADGKPAEIAVVRPIGFGLDENAVAAIRKASFNPAIKAGQPVAESLDLAVIFRIYSKLTSGTAPETPAQAPQPIKPGPYSVKQP